MFRKGSAWAAAILVRLVSPAIVHAQSTAETFQFPLDNYSLSQAFGHFRDTGTIVKCADGTTNKRHTGEDVVGNQAGAQVKAIANGKVIYARNNSAPTASAKAACDGNWGFVMVIEHTTRFGTVSSLYGHIDPAVVEGDVVTKGQVVGSIADYHTSCSTWGNHLHSGVYNGPSGVAQGTYPSWLNGYLCPEAFPSNYFRTSDFVNCQAPISNNGVSWQFLDKNGSGDRSNDLQNAACWIPRGGATTLGFNAPGAWIVSTTNDPQVVSPPLLADASSVGGIEVRIASLASNQQAQVFFETDSSPDFSADKSTGFQSIANDGSYNTYTFPLNNNAQWRGKITRLRFDPVITGDGKAVGIQQVRLLPSNTTVITDPDITRLANSKHQVLWFYIQNSTGRWYIVSSDSNQSVLALAGADRSFDGIIKWKPVSNYQTLAGYPMANVNFSSVVISPDGKTITFGSASGSDSDVLSLANKPWTVKWLYIESNGAWYIVDGAPSTNPAVLKLQDADPIYQGIILWKPINNYSLAVGQYPAATVHYSSVAVASNGRSIQF